MYFVGKKLQILKIQEDTDMKSCGQVSNGATEEAITVNVAKVPTEDQWFKVNPQTINQSLFQKKRKDEKQEKTRQLILEAFAEVKRSPEKYGVNFKTMMPEKIWKSKTIEELEQLACKLGDHNADWVEQALEWAQRISNGESWEAICNNVDAANWYRLIVWKNGYGRLVGGSRNSKYNIPASDIFCCDYDFNRSVGFTVPLIVLREV